MKEIERRELRLPETTQTEPAEETPDEPNRRATVRKQLLDAPLTLPGSETENASEEIATITATRNREISVTLHFAKETLGTFKFNSSDGDVVYLRKSHLVPGEKLVTVRATFTYALENSE